MVASTVLPALITVPACPKASETPRPEYFW
jgi:hypothetical protein